MKTLIDIVNVGFGAIFVALLLWIFVIVMFSL